VNHVWRAKKQLYLSLAESSNFGFSFRNNSEDQDEPVYIRKEESGMIGATIEPANMITGIRLVDKLS